MKLSVLALWIFFSDFETVNTELQHEIFAVKNCSGLRLNEDDIKIDLIRHSTVLWYSFTGLLYPKSFDQKNPYQKSPLENLRLGKENNVDHYNRVAP